jgi:branched-chain amino acid transport system permease protein
MRRLLLRGETLAILILAYPLLTMRLPVYQRLGALVLLAAIGASAWNLIGGYAGQVSVGHAVFFGAGAYAAIAVYAHFGLPAPRSACSSPPASPR